MWIELSDRTHQNGVKLPKIWMCETQNHKEIRQIPTRWSHKNAMGCSQEAPPSKLGSPQQSPPWDLLQCQLPWLGMVVVPPISTVMQWGWWLLIIYILGLPHYSMVSMVTVRRTQLDGEELDRYSDATMSCLSHSFCFPRLWTQHHEVMPKSCLLVFPHCERKHQNSRFQIGTFHLCMSEESFPDWRVCPTRYQDSMVKWRQIRSKSVLWCWSYQKSQKDRQKPRKLIGYHHQLHVGLSRLDLYWL